jgi:hypothetical protein
VTGLRELKRAALEAEDAWQKVRERTLQRLHADEALLDCRLCDRVVITRDAPGHPPRRLWRCPCAPRVEQKVVRGRPARRGEAFAS